MGKFSPFARVRAAGMLPLAGLRPGGGLGRLAGAVRDRIPVNVTVPAVGPEQAHRIVSGSGCRTAKVKVAERGQPDGDDIARVEAVRDALGPEGRIRVDANGGWDVDTAARMLGALGRFGLEYAEQPCATLDELAALRRRVDVPVAADESIRKAEDPLAVRAAGAADIVMLKAQPWAGWPRRCGSPRRAGCPSWCPARSSRRWGWPPGWPSQRRCPPCRTPAAWPR